MLRDFITLVKDNKRGSIKKNMARLTLMKTQQAWDGLHHDYDDDDDKVYLKM
jgi:hypothetical protein